MEWDRCLTDAANRQACAADLRELFVTIIRHCDVGDPLSLWLGDRDGVNENIFHDGHATDRSCQMFDELHNVPLLHIDRCLCAGDYGVMDNRLSSLVDHVPRDLSHKIIEELDGRSHDELRQLQDKRFGQTSTVQRAAFDGIMAAHAALIGEEGGRRRILPADQAGQYSFSSTHQY